MNREQRRKQAKENGRPNSRKNFSCMGMTEIPINQIQHDPNLKECDPEILNLMQHWYEWAEKGLVSKDLSKCIIAEGCSYLDSLCSLRFDITPPDDRVLIRDTMFYAGNFTNLFFGMMLDKESENITLIERSRKHIEEGNYQMQCIMVHDLYPSWNLPNKEIVDDVYAGFVVEHAKELSSFLQHTRKSDIEGDEEYIFEVLRMILKKTDQLLAEAQVKSEKFVVSL